MNRTKIEYADFTWNPVTGCRHGCSYCWARRQVRRFEPSSGAAEADLEDDGTGLGLVYEASRGVPWPFGWKPTLHLYRLDEPRRRRRPARVFVCDMGDLFGAWVPAEWIQAVLQVVKDCPQHRFLLLTKNPSRYGEFEVPPNAWAGTTVTGDGDAERVLQLAASARHAQRWVSWEPALGPFPVDLLPGVDWLVVGAQTGPGARPPDRAWIEELLLDAEEQGVRVFCKSNLGPQWEWCRDYPEGLVVGGRA